MNLVKLDQKIVRRIFLNKNFRNLFKISTTEKRKRLRGASKTSNLVSKTTKRVKTLISDRSKSKC